MLFEPLIINIFNQDLILILRRTERKLNKPIKIFSDYFIS